MSDHEYLEHPGWARALACHRAWRLATHLARDVARGAAHTAEAFATLAGAVLLAAGLAMLCAWGFGS